MPSPRLSAGRSWSCSSAGATSTAAKVTQRPATVRAHRLASAPGAGPAPAPQTPPSRHRYDARGLNDPTPASYPTPWAGASDLERSVRERPLRPKPRRDSPSLRPLYLTSRQWTIAGLPSRCGSGTASQPICRPRPRLCTQTATSPACGDRHQSARRLGDQPRPAPSRRRRARRLPKSAFTAVDWQYDPSALTALAAGHPFCGGFELRVRLHRHENRWHLRRSLQVGALRSRSRRLVVIASARDIFDRESWVRCLDMDSRMVI